MSDARVGARAARETLLAELFADVDTLLRRVEDLPEAMDAAGARLDAAAKSVGAQCNQLAALTTELRHATREDLNALLRRRADEAAATAGSRAAEEIRTVIRASVEEALHRQAQQLAAQLDQSGRRDRSRWRLALTLSTLCAAATVASAAWALLGR